MLWNFDCAIQTKLSNRKNAFVQGESKFLEFSWFSRITHVYTYIVNDFRCVFQFPAILLCITLSNFFFTVVVSNDQSDGPYEPIPADEICDKCNCTKETVTSSSESETMLFSIDCSMHKFSHLLRAWPQEIDEKQQC